MIGSYDPAAGKVDWVLGTGQNRTHMIYVAPEAQVDGDVEHQFRDDDVHREDGGRRRGADAGPAVGPGPGGQGDWDEIVIPVGRGAEGFDVSPDGKEIWAANAQDGTISVIDVATRRVTQTLAANVNGANRLKFTPDGKLVFVSTLSGPDVTIIDAASQEGGQAGAGRTRRRRHPDAAGRRSRVRRLHA